MKKQFVEVYLKELLINTKGTEVSGLDYFYNKMIGEEFVIIYFKNNYRKVVNVTADSELAIIQDVIRALM